jgi:hypothetical protein
MKKKFRCIPIPKENNRQPLGQNLMRTILFVPTTTKKLGNATSIRTVVDIRRVQIKKSAILFLVALLQR